MNWKKLLLTTILASHLLHSCDTNTTNSNTQWSNKSPSTKNITTQTWIAALNIISDNPADDAAEKKLYSTVSKELLNASKKRNELLDNNPELSDQIAYMPYSSLIPLIIKESKLQFVSDGKAFGYWQLEQWARDHVTSMLHKAWIHTSYSPKTNHEDNLLYMLLYFWYLTKEVEKMFPNVQKDDQFLFALWCYNGWKNKMWFLYKKVGSPTTRKKFADKVTHDIMGIRQKPELITDPTYNVPEYRDYFWDITQYNEDKTVIASWTYNGNKIVVEKKKAYIMIRYGEIIRAIGSFLKKK